MALTLRHLRRFAPLALAPQALFLAGCGADYSAPPIPPVATGPSAAYSTWTPGPHDTCTQQIHDTYSTVGPDGKLYPTWHPPIDPATGCSFGHDHGRDPSGSNLFRDVGPLPLGYANEQLDLYDPTGSRHEDHFGHKVEWENGIQLHYGSGLAGSVLSVTCDILTKLHQGTHSKDAFTNNLHELIYHMRCTDGVELHVTIMAAIGKAGEFTPTCGNTPVFVGPPTPANSPDGGGQRVIPDRTCVDQFVLVAPGLHSDFGNGIHESWQTSNNIQREDGHSLAFFNPYYQVNAPARFYDPAAVNITGYSVAACFETEANGDRASGSLCDQSTNNGAITTPLAYDDPQSAFNGVKRFVDINSTVIRNSAGPTVWYTDPFGKHGRTSPFTGSIRQFIAKVDNSSINGNGPGLGFNRSYGAPSSHAPN